MCVVQVCGQVYMCVVQVGLLLDSLGSSRPGDEEHSSSLRSMGGKLFHLRRCERRSYHEFGGDEAIC